MPWGSTQSALRGGETLVEGSHHELLLTGPADSPESSHGGGVHYRSVGPGPSTHTSCVRRVLAARAGSGAVLRAEMTATPYAPVPRTSVTCSTAIPPIARSGRGLCTTA